MSSYYNSASKTYGAQIIEAMKNGQSYNEVKQTLSPAVAGIFVCMNSESHFQAAKEELKKQGKL